MILDKDEISKRNIEKYRTAGGLVIRRPCPVVSAGNLVVSRLDLFVLCVQGWRNGQRLNFFTF